MRPITARPVCERRARPGIPTEKKGNIAEKAFATRSEITIIVPVYHGGLYLSISVSSGNGHLFWRIRAKSTSLVRCVTRYLITDYCVTAENISPRKRRETFSTRTISREGVIKVNEGKKRDERERCTRSALQAHRYVSREEERNEGARSENCSRAKDQTSFKVTMQLKL